MTVSAFIEKYNIDINAYCEYCMQENCIHNNNTTHKCKILNYVDNYGVKCDFFKTTEQVVKEKNKIRAKLKLLLSQNRKVAIDKFLYYNPEIKNDPFYADLFKDYIKEV